MRAVPQRFMKSVFDLHELYYRSELALRQKIEAAGSMMTVHAGEILFAGGAALIVIGMVQLVRKSVPRTRTPPGISPSER